MASHPLTSGQLQRELNISRPRLRDWERRGIITPIHVTRGTRVWREFPLEEVRRIQGILELIERGMTLKGAIRHLDNYLERRDRAKAG